ncbi:MAG: hypothetical protein Q9208_006993 [Pyrenodesmia sp. 3 TL-2023]
MATPPPAPRPKRLKMALPASVQTYLRGHAIESQQMMTPPSSSSKKDTAVTGYKTISSDEDLPNLDQALRSIKHVPTTPTRGTHITSEFPGPASSIAPVTPPNQIIRPATWSSSPYDTSTSNSTSTTSTRTANDVFMDLLGTLPATADTALQKRKRAYVETTDDEMPPPTPSKPDRRAKLAHRPKSATKAPAAAEPKMSPMEVRRMRRSIMEQVDFDVLNLDVASNRRTVVYKRAVKAVLDEWVAKVEGEAQI